MSSPVEDLSDAVTRLVKMIEQRDEQHMLLLRNYTDQSRWKDQRISMLETELTARQDDLAKLSERLTEAEAEIERVRTIAKRARARRRA